MKKKAQVGIEFMFAVGIVFLIFLIIFGFMINRRAEVVESEIKLNKDNTCLLISSLITSAFINGDGLVVNFSIGYNTTINQTDNITNYKGVNVEDSYCLLPIKDIPNSKLRKGFVIIQNQDEEISIENV